MKQIYTRNLWTSVAFVVQFCNEKYDAKFSALKFAFRTKIIQRSHVRLAGHHETTENNNG